MKHVVLTILLIAPISAIAETKQYTENLWCDTALKYIMRGYDAAKKKQPIESMIAIPDQQQRLLAINGWRAAQDGVKKAEAYVYFMQQCLAANKKSEAGEKEAI